MRAPVWPCVLAVFASVALPAAPQPPPPEPTLAAVLERAAAYVAEFYRRLSGIAAEEHYLQNWYSVRRAGERTTLSHRELRSDLVLMKPSSDAPWTEFRDVFWVDGHTIRSRDDRLEALLREPTGRASADVSTILAESARFNIGDVDRNVNTPLFTLRFLEAANQARFRFTRSAEAMPDATASAAVPTPSDRVFRVSTEVWVIAYDEVGARTMIRSAQRKDQPAHGRFWIEPATGRVLVSELIVSDRRIRATIEVSFQSEPLLEMLVPVAMRERYESKPSRSVLEGQATYGRFRQLTP